MNVRAEPGRSFGNVGPAPFPVRSCEVAVPGDAVAAVLDGKALPLPRPNPQRIVVFGDTGCRLASRDATQDCNDINSWPFPRIAAMAAAARPDLVIHVGDYHYREEACPVDHAGCAGSPWGYGFDAWNADFFSPAAPLFAAAPWVLVRGNHEDCNRAGEGWFRFLDRLPMEPACRDFTGAFVARLGDFGIVVVDGAKAEDPKGDPSDMASTLRRQFSRCWPRCRRKPGSPPTARRRDARQREARRAISSARCWPRRRRHADRRADVYPGPSTSSRRSTSAACGRPSSWSAPAATIAALRR